MSNATTWLKLLDTVQTYLLQRNDTSKSAHGDSDWSIRMANRAEHDFPR